MMNLTTLRKRLEPLFEVDAGVLRHAVRLSVLGRWLVWLAGAVMLARRPDVWYPDQVEFLFLNALLAVSNAFVHHRLIRKAPVTWRWVVALAALDVALITANVAVNTAATGNLDNLVFIAYYPSLALFAVVFPSLSLVLAWVTVTAVVYTLVSVTAGPGVNTALGQDNVLLARVFVMFLVPLGVSLVARFERARREAAMARERLLQQERIDLSQAIHDTNAQTAYMIGLGIDGAIRAAGDSNPKLIRRLAATAELARTAMWELRGPIDMGRIFEGTDLARVLGGHVATFSAITSVPAELVQSGEEPPLSLEARSGLFSIAHNALANAFLHARARTVEVGLHFSERGVRLTVSDDGIGLPQDYCQRGRGFSGMEKEAEKMGGSLRVESSGPGGGTTIVCFVPRLNALKGD